METAIGTLSILTNEQIYILESQEYEKMLIITGKINNYENI